MKNQSHVLAARRSRRTILTLTTAGAARSAATTIAERRCASIESPIAARCSGGAGVDTVSGVLSAPA